MKKTYYITAGLLSLVLGFQFANAASNFTGEAYAEIFGTVLMSDPDDPSSPSYEVTVEDIGTHDCDYDTQTCNLGGFSWSDVTGWTIWDGDKLRTEMTNKGFDFPDGYIAKATYRGNIGGFIWGEKYGWVQLSACAGMTSMSTCNAKSYCQWNATTPGSCEVNQDNGLIGDIAVQDSEDWGVYIDFCPVKNQSECTSTSHCVWNTDDRCVFAGDPEVGHPLRGYALSENLGWIKFGPDSTESDFDGAYTTWFPDLTPPELRVLNPDNTWIPANNPNTSALIWEDFARDNDSALKVYFADSFFDVTKDTDAQFNKCPNQTTLDSNKPNISPNNDLSPADPDFNPDLVGAVDLFLPKLAEVNLPDNGFCKYTLGGVIYNGSGFGLYVGPEGKQKAMNDWSWDGTNEDDILPNVLYEDPITLYVRAGEYDPTKSTYSFTDYSDASGTPVELAQAVADGENYTTLRFQPKDVSGNPIIDVKANNTGSVTATEGTWVRNVSMDFIYGNEGEDMRIAFTNDSINKYRYIGTGLSAPFSVGGVKAPYEITTEIDYPYADGPNNVVPIEGSYIIDTYAYAPFVVSNNKLDLERIDLVLDDRPIPAISPSTSPVDTSFSEDILALAGDTPHTFDFAPALNTTGSLSTDILVMNSPSIAEYIMENRSNGTEITDYAIDHLMYFEGAETPLMEIKNIDLENPADLNGDLGRTNPNLPPNARYTVFKEGDAESTAFHSAVSTYHTPTYSMTAFDLDGLDSRGVFEVDGALYANSSDPCKQPDGPACPAMEIDRNDIINKSLLAKGTAPYSFNFQASQIGGQSISGSNTFTTRQYLAYTTEVIANSFPMNIYEGGAVLGPFEVKAIGLGTSGTVSGSQIYETIGGRDLETITTTSSADLRKEIRRNVAVLTRTMAACSVGGSIQASGDLPINGSCVQTDDANKTVVAYYSGSGVVRLADSGPVTVPDGYKYTIILDGGANLSIENNISYNSSDSEGSLGIILLSDSNDNGANVYIHPAPTNIVGLLYAEGSVLSSPDAGTSFYYNGENSTADLKNQLYWQGSVASKNTIGGSANNNTPEGVDCSNWSDGQSCAQAYDLDFLRRFVVVTKDGVSYSPSTYIFSGGGTCNPDIDGNANCSHGNASLSTITLDGDSIDLDNSKSTDTIFIERDNRPVPPGFTSSGGLTSSQEIR